mmetsp:Transcript_104578/g.293059  ORF Transcript_104578/g.293059 Transcript_104578/m.293059 type:complete len:154 (+) Transcript_104578:67-528(+)
MQAWTCLDAPDVVFSCGKASDMRSTCSGGLSSVETHFEPLSEGALKLSGSADLEPTGEELWRRRLELIPDVSESCPWATIDAGSLARAFGRYCWQAEAAESVGAPSQEATATQAEEERAPAETAEDVWKRRERDYAQAWMRKLLSELQPAGDV